MGCFRCSTCGVSWPQAVAYEYCPECKGKCGRMDDPSIPMDEARSRLNHACFERYCEERELDQLEKIPTLGETA